jgi:type I restriction enzyme M protein
LTEISHNHPEGIKGAEAIAMAVYLARIGKSKEEIKQRMIRDYYPQIKYMTVEGIRPNYGIDDNGDWVTCQGSVPHSLVSFFDSIDFEDAVRNGISLGGDADTIGCMAGAVAEAYYGISYDFEDKALSYLADDLKGIYYAFDMIRKKRVKREE